MKSITEIAHLEQPPACPPVFAQQQFVQMNEQVVMQLSSNDILLGRGAPSIDNEGNIRFRMDVQERKKEYTSTGKRQVKDWIARQVIQKVNARGGRFLRKIESLVEAETLGIPEGATAWVSVDEATILQKVKQALRDRDPDESKKTSPEDDKGRRKRTPMVIPTVPDTSVTTAASAFFMQQTSDFNKQRFHEHKRRLQQQQQQQQQQQTQSIVDSIPGLQSNMSLASALGFARDNGPHPSMISKNRVSFPHMHSSNRGSERMPMPLGGSASPHHMMQRCNPEPRPLSAQAALRVAEKIGEVTRRRTFSKEDTVGDQILRDAMRKTTNQTSGLALSQLEVLVLQVASSYGLPPWTPNGWGRSMEIGGNGWTWHKMAQRVVVAAREAHGAGYNPQATQKAVEMATEYSTNVPALANIVLSIVEKLSVKSGGTSLQRSAISRFLAEQVLAPWATCLQVSDLSTGRPSTYTAADFVQDFPQSINATVAPVAVLDVADCSPLYEQVAAATRLRAMNLGIGLAETLKQALLNSRWQDRVWQDQPSWWGSQLPSDAGTLVHDVALLENVLSAGYTGLLSQTVPVRVSGSAADSASPQSLLTYRDLNISKSLLQKRTEQLVSLLSQHLSVIDRQRVVEAQAQAYFVLKDSDRGHKRPRLSHV